MSNVRRGRRRDLKISLWVNRAKLETLDLIAETRDTSRASEFERAMDLLIASDTSNKEIPHAARD
jgi:hypothetical protein